MMTTRTAISFIFALILSVTTSALASDQGSALSDDALLNRWLPRLKDSSSEIREEAAKTMADSTCKCNTLKVE
ncbi:MAG: hypothetical protein EOM03_18690 [Clostridia bacterium]|nr:hypothetical protein [Clostridia bacterium]